MWPISRPEIVYRWMKYVLLGVKKAKIGSQIPITEFRTQNKYGQGRIGHITKWEKSHGASLDWGPLKQSRAPQHHDLFFISAWFVEIFCSCRRPIALWSSYLMTFVFFSQQFRFCSKLFFLGAPFKKFPPKFGEPVRPFPNLSKDWEFYMKQEKIYFLGYKRWKFRAQKRNLGPAECSVFNFLICCNSYTTSRPCIFNIRWIFFLSVTFFS
jgi:hypothetical protein